MFDEQCYTYLHITVVYSVKTNDHQLVYSQIVVFCSNWKFEIVLKWKG